MVGYGGLVFIKNTSLHFISLNNSTFDLNFMINKIKNLLYLQQQQQQQLHNDYKVKNPGEK